MTITQSSLFCHACKRQTLHQKSVFGVGWGLFFTFLTGGIFIPIWILVVIFDSGKPYFCMECNGIVRQNAALPDPPVERKSVGAAPPGCLRCPGCSSLLKLNARFCRDCGTPIPA